MCYHLLKITTEFSKNYKMKIFEKFKGAKLKLRCLREGNELLEAQNTEAKDFDDKWLIESKDLKWSFPIVARAIRKRQEKLIVYEPQEAQVFCGIQGDYANREYCEKNNIKVTPFPTQGGALVTNKGDMLFMFIHPLKVGEFDFLKFIKPRIIQYLANYVGIENITTPGNDIEIHGKKISGSSASIKMGARMESIFITGNPVNKEMMESVGHKGKVRELTSLAENGIDINEFRCYVIEQTQRAALIRRNNREEGKGRKYKNKSKQYAHHS